MKKNSFKYPSMLVVIMLFAFLTSCNGGETEQNAAEEIETPEMAEEMEMEGMEMMEEEAEVAAVDTENEPAILVEYIDIKNALVNDNFEKVKQAAVDLQSSLGESGFSEELNSSLQSLVEAEDIKAQRLAFAQLSQQLYEVVQSEELTDKTLFWQYCPMALGGDGANWLSYEEQVRNPFMGQRMPGCGSVAETIN